MELEEARIRSSSAFDAELNSQPETRTRALGEIINTVGFEEALEIASALGSSVPAERSLSAHLLRQLHEIAPDVRIPQLLAASLRGEVDSYVIAPQILALGRTRTEQFLDLILQFETHESSDVRHAVSDVLGMYAPDERAERALLNLALDIDADVRWSAVFELGAWLRDVPSERVAETLNRLATSDPDMEVRDEARASLDGIDH